MAVAGSLAALAEPSEFVPADQTDADRVAAIINDGLTLPLSPRGRYWVTRQCYLAITSIYVRVATGPKRQALFDRCSTLAERITSSEPLNGFAFLLTALVAGEAGNAAAFNAALTHAQVAAPYEGWLSRLRVDVGERYYDQLDGPGRAQHDADLAVTASVVVGLAQIASLYVANPERRDGITDVIETLGPNLQTRFLAEVRAEMARRP